MVLCRWLLAELTLYKAAQSAASASLKSHCMSRGFLGSLIKKKRKKEKLFESSNDPLPDSRHEPAK